MKLWYSVNILTLVSSEWIFLLDKLIFTSLGRMDKLNFEENFTKNSIFDVDLEERRRPFIDTCFLAELL